jgi:hypothetical protein
VEAYKSIDVDKPHPPAANLEGLIAGEDIAEFEKLVKATPLLKNKDWSYADEIRFFEPLDERDGDYAFGCRKHETYTDLYRFARRPVASAVSISAISSPRLP